MLESGSQPLWGTDVQFLFANHTLDTDRRELLRGAEPIAVEPQVFDLLVYLVRNRDRVVSKDDLIAAVWGGRIVSNRRSTSRINAARKAVGDSGEDQRLIRTIARKGVRFVGDVSEADQLMRQQPASPQAARRRRRRTRKSISARASDGVRIAYAEVGQGPPLVKAANWLNHLEYDWESPIWSHLLHALAAEHRLVRYDARGNGLSDWDVDDISFDAFVRDLESVVEPPGSSGLRCSAFRRAAPSRSPMRCVIPSASRHLVLYGGFARGRRKRGSQREIEQADAMLTLMRQGWGQENPAFRQMFTSLFIPAAPPSRCNGSMICSGSPRRRKMPCACASAVDDIDVDRSAAAGQGADARAPLP